jgi:predicted dehydrogenase
MMEKLGLGLVGAGGFGEFCVDAYSRMEEINVVAVADIDLERAEAIAPPPARCYPTYHKLLADPDVEIVAINTPPHLHASMAIEAAVQGKHIFVEKPLATNLEDAVEVADAVQGAGVKISINYILRHHPIHKIAIQVIREQALGPFQHWSLENFASDDVLLPDHWFWDQSQSGGIHVEHGVHFFDLCNQMVGDYPTEVSGFSQSRQDSRVDRVFACVRYADQVLASYYHSFNQIGVIEQTTIRLKCSRGQVVIEGWIPTELSLSGLVNKTELLTLKSIFREQLTIHDYYDAHAGLFNHGGTSERLHAAVSVRITAPHRQAEYRRAIQIGLRNLITAIREDCTPEVSIQDGISSLTIALAATDSALSGTIAHPSYVPITGLK